MGFAVSDEILVAIVPTIVYWTYSGLYGLLGDMDNYRIHPKSEENTKNLVPKRQVIKGVLLQQSFQIGVSIAMFMFTGSGETPPQPPLFVMLCQLFIAAVILDTHQYFLHRFMHTNKYLAKIHAAHHHLLVPYAYGAIYSHPLDGIMLEIVGSGIASVVSGMTPRTSMYFFVFGTMKAVDDHCGILLPGNPIQKLFTNNAAYHDIHHQLYGNKYNFSQPFFVTWDKICGTYMGYSLEKRQGGGFEVKPQLKEIKDD